MISKFFNTLQSFPQIKYIAKLCVKSNIFMSSKKNKQIFSGSSQFFLFYDLIQTITFFRFLVRQLVASGKVQCGRAKISLTRKKAKKNTEIEKQYGEIAIKTNSILSLFFADSKQFQFPFVVLAPLHSRLHLLSCL